MLIHDFVFKRMAKREAYLVAEVLERMTGDLCRVVGSNRFGFVVERFDGSIWREG